MLDELKSALSEKLIDFSYDNKLCEYLADKCDGGKRGARELRNIIRRELESQVVDIIVANGEGSIKSIFATAKDKIEIETVMA
jgi:ATP-dependent Clp protease ATP-binding subunit ClpA